MFLVKMFMNYLGSVIMLRNRSKNNSCRGWLICLNSLFQIDLARKKQEISKKYGHTWINYHQIFELPPVFLELRQSGRQKDL